MAQDWTDNIPDVDNNWDDDIEKIADNFSALKSAFSGALAPADPVAGMPWLDTTNHIHKIRNEANNAWLSIWDMANNKPFVSNLISADFGAALKDAAAETASLRTLGTTSTSACAGNDDRLLDDGRVEPLMLQACAAGDVLLIASDAAVTQHNGSYTKVKEIYVPRAGILRIKFKLEGATGAVHGHGRIYRNGVAVGIERSTQTSSGDTYSEDIDDWQPGDLCQLYIYHHINGDVTVSNFRIYSDAGFEFVSSVL
jgi:hypothetical protein